MTGTPRRAVATAAVALALVGGLAGCGGRLRHPDGGTAPSASAPADAVVPSPGDAAAPAADDSSAEAGDSAAAASVRAAVQQADQVLASGEAAVAQDG